MQKKQDEQARVKLTTARVQSMSTVGYFWDTDAAGFCVRVNPGGKKTYFARYRNSMGQQKWQKVGQHPMNTADEARSQARIVLGESAKGIDPAIPYIVKEWEAVMALYAEQSEKGKKSVEARKAKSGTAVPSGATNNPNRNPNHGSAEEATESHSTRPGMANSTGDAKKPNHSSECDSNSPNHGSAENTKSPNYQDQHQNQTLNT
jgi:hypothetical protein